MKARRPALLLAAPAALASALTTFLPWYSPRQYTPPADFEAVQP